MPRKTPPNHDLSRVLNSSLTELTIIPVHILGSPDEGLTRGVDVELRLVGKHYLAPFLIIPIFVLKAKLQTLFDHTFGEQGLLGCTAYRNAQLFTSQPLYGPTADMSK